MTENRLISNGELHLTGPVGFVDFFGDDGFTVRGVTTALSELEGDITVRINSGGGFAFDGIAIHSLLRQHDGKVTTVVQGIAASAASVIFMAGDERIMAEGAILMIHDASGLTMGTEADHLQTAKMLGKLSNSLAGIYAGRTKRGNDVERAAMRDETWLDGADAVEAGFATEATNTGAAEASAFNYSMYKNAPEFLMESGQPTVEEFDRVAAALTVVPHQPKKENIMVETQKSGAAPVVTAPETIALTLDILKADHPDIVAALTAELDADDDVTLDGLKAAYPAFASEIATDAVEAECDRIKKCQAVLLLDSSDETKALCFDANKQPGDVALAVNAEIKAKGDNYLAGLKVQEDDLDKAGLKAAPVATTTETKPAPATTPEGWTAEFEASDALKAEFPTAAEYTAFMVADTAGTIRILRGKEESK